MNNLFIAQAFASGTEAASQGQFSLASFVPLILIFAIFYFLIIRPQTKKMKEHEQLVNNLKIGNKVVTSSGIVGVVRKIYEKENQVALEIADGVVVSFVKNHITEVEKNSDDKHADKNDKNDKKSKKH